LRIFEFNKRKLWKYLLKSTFITLSIHILVALIFLKYKNVKDLEQSYFLLLVLLLGWFLFFQLPLLILFFNHLKHSKSTKLKVSGEGINFTDGFRKIIFKKDEIEKLTLSLTPPYYYKRIDFLYFGHYSFLTIVLKNGEKLVLSCLVLDKPTRIFKKNLIERKKNNFPLIS